MYALKYDHTEVETMPTNERVTVTLPAEVVRDIDRIEKNRSKFVLDAVRHELKRRRRQDLQRSLRNPHPESEQLAEAGFGEWASGLPEEDAVDLVDMKAGTPVRWVPGEGWVEASK
jgi:Arc/MetJ-type ribon-helix-helix transcriptional regulator